MKKIILSIFLLSSIAMTAQEQHNLVPNPSFEEVSGKIKDKGQVTLAEPWRAVNMFPVDLYSTEAKNEAVGVPNNEYGAEKPKTGNNYAGVSFFGYRGRLPRTYLGTMLTNPMTEGREYCLRFHVSLADKSKYAVNNLAMYVSKEEVIEPSEKDLNFTPQVKSITNEVFEQQFLWTPICRTYKATGGEQYIVIGNFDKDEDTKQETLRLSREFSGRQSYDSYYYIDDVSVIPMDVMGDDKCACDKIAGGSMEVEFKKFGGDESDKAKATTTYLVNSDGSKAGSTTAKPAAGETTTAAASKAEAPAETKAYPSSEEIMFASKKFLPGAAEIAKLEKLAEYLKSNPKAKVKIIGHADPSETSVAFIGKRRAFNVQKELIKLGVSKTRIPYESKETDMPASESNAAKNQRVTFQLM